MLEKWLNVVENKLNVSILNWTLFLRLWNRSLYICFWFRPIPAVTVHCPFFMNISRGKCAKTSSFSLIIFFLLLLSIGYHMRCAIYSSYNSLFLMVSFAFISHGSHSSGFCTSVILYFAYVCRFLHYIRISFKSASNMFVLHEFPLTLLVGFVYPSYFGSVYLCVDDTHLCDFGFCFHG